MQLHGVLGEAVRAAFADGGCDGADGAITTRCDTVLHFLKLALYVPRNPIHDVLDGSAPGLSYSPRPSIGFASYFPTIPSSRYNLLSSQVTENFQPRTIHMARWPSL